MNVKSTLTCSKIVIGLLILAIIRNDFLT